VISIILATYNERQNIEEMIKRIFYFVPHPLEVIVVDDDSPDKTWQIVSGMNHDKVKVIRRTKERGLASALLRGIIESKGDIIGWWDTDMLMCPEKVPEMLKALETHDIAIGSRYVDVVIGDCRPWSRRITSLMVNKLASFVLGYGIRDYDSGFILMRRSALDLCIPVPTGFGEYFIEFIYCCAKRGASIIEVPYIMTDREHGISKASGSKINFLITGFRYVVRIFIAKVRGSR
jgi:dolichol-phosphate mannosyltransferase